MSKPITPEELAALLDGMDPIDWVQLRLLVNLPPERRIVPAMRAQAFAMAAMRGTLKKRYPHLSKRELNLKVLAHFTPLRGITLPND